MKVIQQLVNEDFSVYNGDSCEVLKAFMESSVHLTVTSIPFASLYTYNDTPRDLGNSAGWPEFFDHFSFIVKELLRVTVPGRLACIHVQQIAAQKAKDGYIGLKDFRGEVVRSFEREDWIYHGEVTIDKCPQVQAIRTKAKGLMFVQLHKDSSWSRQGLADYILVFRKPGDNPVPIQPDVTNEEWIQWARPVWYNINETDTLDVAEGRDEKDERHICPLQLGTIERCIRLWSNPGDVVLDPFNGIGSTGYIALKHNRKYIGVELKPSYYNASIRNLNRMISQKINNQLPLFGVDNVDELCAYS